MEKGGKYPPARVIEKLSEALEVPAARLFMSDGEVFAHIAGGQWTKFQELLEGVTVLTENMHEMLERFQTK